MYFRHSGHHLSNNVPSQVVIRGGVVQEPRSNNRRQVNQNMGALNNSNQVYQAPAQQPSNMTVSSLIY